MDIIEEALTPPQIHSFLAKKRMDKVRLARILNLSPSTVRRWLSSEGERNSPTGTAAAVLALLMVLSGEPLRLSQARAGYRLYKELASAFEEAGAENNKLLLALNDIDEFHRLKAEESDAMVIYRLHVKYLKTAPKTEPDSAWNSPFLLPLLESMRLEEDVERLKQGEPVFRKLNPHIIGVRFMQIRRHVKERLEKLKTELGELFDVSVKTPLSSPPPEIED